MTRFLIGLAAGLMSGCVTWYATDHSGHWTVCVGLFVAAIIWFKEILVEIFD